MWKETLSSAVTPPNRRVTLSSSRSLLGAIDTDPVVGSTDSDIDDLRLFQPVLDLVGPSSVGNKTLGSEDHDQDQNGAEDQEAVVGELANRSGR